MFMKAPKREPRDWLGLILWLTLSAVGVFIGVISILSSISPHHFPGRVIPSPGAPFSSY